MSKENKMENQLNIRHQMQIARRKNLVKVKPSGKVYSRKNQKLN
jgi:hypothetical protein